MASNNRMDLLGEARLALLAQRARLGSSETPSAGDVLEMATIGGARALGVDTVAGTLEVGKQADLVAFSLDGVQPTFDPLAAAVFAVAGGRAQFAAVAGRVLVRDGRLVTARDGLAARMQSLAKALGEWLAAGGELRGTT